jgi:hypothetical protein
MHSTAFDKGTILWGYKYIDMEQSMQNNKNLRLWRLNYSFPLMPKVEDIIEPILG